MGKTVRLVSSMVKLDKIHWYVFVVEGVRFGTKKCTSLFSKEYPLFRRDDTPL